ncbi:EAL domain-containing protein [Bacillus sp. FJAT-50079]|uniref:sensor domain-containing protein n=1 Tax=Bacillus sp. FJAT-50079 TaxID=2833577 RepID=UPI001BC8E2D9|nr:EAL domain-containing protein [Bacillus sp. FJAT-50079]MBS4207801.1 EAL domain-containing protein [Bacillus sp. FJAT-50079]
MEIVTDSTYKKSKQRQQGIEKLIAEILFHHFSDMVFIMEIEEGPKFRYLFVNQAGMDFAKLDENPVGKLLEDVIPSERVFKIYSHYKKALHSNELVMYTEEQVDQDGAIFESSFKIMRNENNDPTHLIWIIRKIDDKHAETIKQLERSDRLTGLWNRKAMMEHLQTEISRAETVNQEFSIVNVNIDRFKQFNDSLGHHIGDQLLKMVAGRMAQWNQPTSRLYHLSGDEFIILIINTNRKETKHDVQEILQLFDQPFYIDNEEYYMTPSIGVSMFPQDGKDANTLLKNANRALFFVKDQGKDHSRFYCSAMETDMSNFLMMESHLKNSIENKELTLHYQPQVNLKTGKIESFEALLRWNNWKLGSVSPAVFIPIAEQSGLIVLIGEWVIKEVCRQIAEWRDKGYKNIRVAINISPRQFIQKNLPYFIKQTLDQYDLPPTSIEIEITEGAMHDTNATLEILNKLKQLGMILSVDDFGTGYSSLNYLKRYPIDILKIDRSFIGEIKMNDKDAAITKTIIHLAHSLGLEVVAEGVEEARQVEFLTEAQCQKAQGFYFSHPLQAEEIEANILSKGVFS